VQDSIPTFTVKLSAVLSATVRVTVSPIVHFLLDSSAPVKVAPISSEPVVEVPSKVGLASIPTSLISTEMLES